MMTVLEERPARLPLAEACRALGINRSTVYAWRQRGHKQWDGVLPTLPRRRCATLRG